MKRIMGGVILGDQWCILGEIKLTVPTVFITVPWFIANNKNDTSRLTSCQY